MKSIDHIISDICKEDPRYAREAYYFLYEALDYTQKTLHCVGHVTGQQLMEGIRQLALEHFGMLGYTVFKEWGLKKTKDFGNVVFNLVAKNAMGKTEEDHPEDFEELFDLEKALGNLEIIKKEWKINE